MKRNLLSLFLMIFLSAGFVSAQEAQELMITFDSKLPPANAVQIKLSGSAKGVEEIMLEKLKKATALKVKKEGDVMMVRAALIADISTTKMDYSYRVDKAEKGATLTFFTSLGNNNYIRSDKYPQEIANVKKFLMSLENEVKIFDQDILVKAQAEVVKKDESKLKDAEKEVADLDKKRKELNTQIDKAEKAVQEQKVVLDNAKSKLSEQEGVLKTLKGN